MAGNRLTLLPDGPQRLEALIGLIDGAQSLAARPLLHLVRGRERARGCATRWCERRRAGSRSPCSSTASARPTRRSDFFAPLAEAGARFCRFVPRYGRRYLLRNHQKLALADGRKVIIGGFNISDDYFGTIAEGAWRDLGLQVEGDSVECLVGYFEALFAWALKPEARIRDLRRLLNQNSVTEGKLHWLFGGPTRRLSPWARAVRRDMKRARRLDIIAAYFAPGPLLMRRAGNVARRRRGGQRAGDHPGQDRPSIDRRRRAATPIGRC